MHKINAAIFIAHIVGCLIFLSAPLLFIIKWSNGQDIFDILFSTGYLVFCVTFLTVFYLNAYLLVPFFYLKKKFLAYAAIILLMLFVVFMIKPFDLLSKGMQTPPGMGYHDASKTVTTNEKLLPPPKDPNLQGGPGSIDPISIFFFLLAIALGLSIRTTSQLIATEQRAANAETEKANAELSFLKAQINPHFLFNSLNSIYALAIRKDDGTANAVVLLSDLMRYIIKDANDDFVPLQKEIDYISNYIELQKSRLGDTVIIDHQYKGDMEGLQIVPLILSSFIENAFKYGVNPDRNSKIELMVAVLEGQIRLYVFNRKTNSVRHESGIGLKNTKKRLEMIYPQKHELVIKDERDSFTVHLLINLK